MFQKLVVQPLLNYTIQLKLRSSYIVFTLIILLGSSFFLYHSNKQKDVVVQVTQVAMPLVYRLQLIREGLSEMSAMSGLYLLTRDEQYKASYSKNFKQLFSNFKVLEQDKFSHTQSSLKQLKTRLEALDKQYRNLMTIGSNDLKNKPALQLAAEKIGPIFNQMLQVTSSMIDSEADMDDVEEEIRKNILKIIYSIRSQWLNLSRDITVYLTYRGEAFAEKYPVSLEQLNQAVSSLSAYADDFSFEQETGYEDLQAMLKSYSEALKQLVIIHNGEGWRQDTQLIHDHLGPLLSKTRNTIDSIIETKRHEADKDEELLLSDAQSLETDTILFMVSSFLVAILLIILLKFLVMDRLKTVQLAMQEISSGGGLSHTLDETGRDELAVLGGYFNIFVGKIKRIVDLVIISSSNLAKEAFKMSSVTECAQELSSTQEKKVTEISQINEEMSRQMIDIAEQAVAAANSVEEAKQVAENGRNIVRQSITSVQKIATEVEASSQVVQNLADDSNSIGEVVGVIQSISEQTNLLALNAAIEAARAGDAGRGFAVVADEVRSLSHKIQEETIIIKEKIDKLQHASTDVVDKMSVMQKHADTTVELSSEAGDAFNNIVSDITVVTEMNKENAEQTKIQRKNNERINGALEQLTIMSQTMAKTSQEARDSGNEFKIMAEQLKDIVEQFVHDPEGSMTLEDKSAKKSADTAVNKTPCSEIINDIEMF